MGLKPDRLKSVCGDSIACVLALVFDRANARSSQSDRAKPIAGLTSSKMSETAI